jgi:hypothetical protein
LGFDVNKSLICNGGQLLLLLFDASFRLENGCIKHALDGPDPSQE